jgi:PQQ-dependent dehydrogenase (methanol/ethanol family)
MSRRFIHVLAALALFAMVGLPALAQTRDYPPVTNEMILNPDPADWLQWRRTVDNWGFSPLDQIDRSNVTDLELAWAWPMPIDGLQEVAPIVHGGLMFLATNQNILQALDAKTGDLVWTYTHVRPEFVGGYHNYQATRQKNSVALWQDQVILSTVDAKLISLDALSGQVNWEVQVHDWEKGYSFTSGPLIVDDKIIIGVSGCSILGTAGGCYITAHDANSGEELWRFNTLDDPNNPEFEASWGGVPLENRWGATPWTTGSYDPELNLTYWGTGMPIPYAEIIRGTGDGDVLYTNATLALDADTGELAWYFQHLPRDNWDLDSPFERILVDAEVDGVMRKLLVSVPGKSSIAFALDRETGEFIWAKETVYQNVVSSIDPVTGRVQINLDTVPTEEGQEVLFCPSISGGKLWQAAAYSPMNDAFFIPLADTCQTLSPIPVNASQGTAVGGIRSGPRQLSPGAENVGVVEALAVATGDQLWRYETRPTISSSVVTTAGGLVFGGDAGRYFTAWDQDTGEVLWQSRLNAPIGGYPMTYMIDGVQYVVAPTGFSAQANSSARLYPEIPVPATGNSIFVFKLRGH